jgi:hypothetical protein
MCEGERNMREKILLAGGANTCKTLSLVNLAVLYPDKKVVILDPDDGVHKALNEIGCELPNLTVIPVTKDWEELMKNYEMIKAELGEGDWLGFDMLNRLWDLSQQFYSQFVFGMSPIQHLLELRKQAKSIGFGGFDGLQDWTIIKRLHNEQLIDDAVLSCKFNVMATTSVDTYLPVEKVPTVGTAGIFAKEFGIKVGGEKGNVYRFDTQAYMYPRDGKYYFRLVRDRGRTVDVKKEFDITGSNFMTKYVEYRGLAV